MNAKKILIIRPDRLGDVILTTPLNQALKKISPHVEISWLVRSCAAPLLQGNPNVQRVIVDPGGSVRSLAQLIQSYDFDEVIVVLPRLRYCISVWLARIPKRIGPWSKWYSIFLNVRIDQRRSRSKKHEAQYNLDLLQNNGQQLPSYPTEYYLQQTEKEKAIQKLTKLGVTFRKPIVFLHPGSGGSAPRWPFHSFIQLAKCLMVGGWDVIVTLGPGETDHSELFKEMGQSPIVISGGSVSIRELAALISCGNVLVSNSTGPLHIAVALGVSTISMYGTAASFHPRQWGPYTGSNVQDKNHTVFVDPNVCATELSNISVLEVLNACQKSYQKNIEIISRSSIRVLHLSNELSWRGGENQIALLIQGLVHDPSVQNFAAFPTQSQALSRLAVDVQTMALPSRAAWDPRSVWRIVQYCKDHHIDLIDAHSSGGHSLALLAKRFLPNIRIVVHKRTDIPPQDRFFTRNKYLTQRVDHYVAISQAIQKVLISFGVSSDKISVIHSAVDAMRYRTISRTASREALLKNYQLDPQTVLIGNASALDVAKGHRDFIQALRQARFDEVLKFHVFLAGIGPDVEFLKKQVRLLGLSRHVTFLGFLQNVPTFLSGLDILCMPSRQEGLGTLLMDAIYAGCAIVSTRTGGIPELIMHQKTGLLSDPGDISSLANHLIQVIRDRNLRKELNDAAQRHLQKNFSLSGMVEGNLAIYRQVLER